LWRSVEVVTQESNAVFLKRMIEFLSTLPSVNFLDSLRLIALAERGAAIPDEPPAHVSIAIHDEVETATGLIYHTAIGDRIYRAMIQTALKEAKP
jgi:hypothetical protein